MAVVIIPLLTEAVTLVPTDAIPRTIEDYKLFKKFEFTQQDTSYNYVINTNGEEETENISMGRGHGSLTDVCYNRMNFS